MWNNLEIEKNNIKYATYKSVLIQMPHKCKFDGYKFWHPSKLVRQGRQSNIYNMAYTDEFTFHLKKYGNGRYNRNEVIDEIDISAEQMEQCFNIASDESEESYLRITEPEKIEVKSEVNKDLLNK